MLKYSDTQVTLNEYQRCFKITINNPYQATPFVQFEEERVIRGSDGVVVFDKLQNRQDNPGLLTKVINNYGDTYRLYNPTTQTRTGGSINIANVYAIIWSVYIEEALIRDGTKAKNKVLADFEAAELVTLTGIENTQILPLWDAYNTNEATYLADAQALADTKTTVEEKAQVFADYNMAKIGRKAVVEAQEASIRAQYETDKAARKVPVDAAAQAAYDAIWNG